jgi:hypothetical protein
MAGANRAMATLELHSGQRFSTFQKKGGGAKVVSKEIWL